MRPDSQSSVPFSAKKELLAKLYELYEDWVSRYTLACRRGCASCCTQSVSMTELEGRIIIEHLEKACEGSEQTVPATTGPLKAPLTFIRYAALCLAGDGDEGEEGEAAAEWHMAPCPFLKEDVCSIYEVRPFGCRSFCSLTDCAQSGEAETPPLVVGMNTVVMQIIEHLDRGRHWGVMRDILAYLQRGVSTHQMLSVCQPIPGFLVPEEEREEVARLYDRVMALEAEGKTMDEWLFSNL